MGFKILNVDLTAFKSKIIDISNETVRNYIGGRGLGARLMLDLVPPETDPLGPENVIMILTGPMTGSLMPGGVKHALITKSPATNSFLDCYSSGMLGIQLKFAGYDGLIISGSADKPTMLYIHNDRLEFIDASDLWGKDSFTASEIIVEKYNDNEIGHAVIGPAGENKVLYACINNDYYRQLGRGGAGAVMGSKMLKAIVIKGTRGIPCFNSKELLSYHKEKISIASVSQAAMARKRAGTGTTFDVANNAGMLPVNNFQMGQDMGVVDKIDANAIAESSKASIACYGCITPCGKIIERVDRNGAKFRIEGPEYETLSLLGSNLGIKDLDFVAEANLVCDKMGLDTISVGNVIGFLMECNEKGILGSDFEQFHNYFGDKNGLLRLIEDIALREGIGDLLANGVRHLGEKIGQGSEDFAMQSKGLEYPGYDPRRAFGAGLAYAVCPRGACHRRAWPPAKEVLGGVDPYVLEGKAQMVKSQYDDRNVLHSLIACDFHMAMIPLSMEDYMRYMELCTGEKYTLDELRIISDRIETAIRLFNSKAGLSRVDDSLPKRTLEEPMLNGPAEGKFITSEGFNKMLDDYYDLRGWDTNGHPKPETLSKYRIEEAATYEI